MTEDPQVSIRQDELWRGVDEGWGVGPPTLPSASRRTARNTWPSTTDSASAHGVGSSTSLAGGSRHRARPPPRGPVAGIDASERLVAVARDRNPDATCGSGHARHALGRRGVRRRDELPGDLGNDPRRDGRGVPSPGPRRPGRADGLGSHQGLSRRLGAGAFTLAATPKVENQAAMVALGRPGVGEKFLQDAGFAEVERIDIPFVFESADPEIYARALASTGPAFEAIQEVGEKAFFEAAVDLARERVRDGLPLRAPVAVVGYVAKKPPPPVHRNSGRLQPMSRTRAFSATPRHTPEAQRLFDADLDGVGYVTNVSRLWAYMPTTLDGLSDLMGASDAGRLPHPPATSCPRHGRGIDSR